MEVASNSLTVNFGKHTNKTVEQIKSEDINWLIWLVNSYDPYYNPFARSKPLKRSTIQYRLSIKSEAKRYVDEYFTAIADKNRETSQSEFVGTLKKRQSFNLKITKIGTYITSITPDNDIVTFFHDGELNVGDEIVITGTPTKHSEYIGKKQTYINRIKF